MNNQEYIANAVTTEGTITDELRRRMAVSLCSLSSVLASVAVAGENLDELKKFIYYGKPTGDALEEFFDGTNIPVLQDWEIRMAHGIIGLITEAAELAEALLPLVNPHHLKHSSGIDRVNIQEELGDLRWYDALIHDALKLNPYETAQKNIDKLRARYPDKFTEKAAVTRDLAKERATLEAQTDGAISGGRISRLRAYQTPTDSPLKLVSETEMTDRVSNSGAAFAENVAASAHADIARSDLGAAVAVPVEMIERGEWVVSKDENSDITMLVKQDTSVVIADPEAIAKSNIIQGADWGAGSLSDVMIQEIVKDSEETTVAMTAAFNKRYPQYTMTWLEVGEEIHLTIGGLGRHEVVEMLAELKHQNAND